MRCGRDRRLGVNAGAADGGGLEPALLLHPGGKSIASEVSIMIGFNNDAGSAGGDSSYSPAPRSSGASSSVPAPSRRGWVRSADFGMPERQGLLDLARTYLEVQARLWPDLAGKATPKEVVVPLKRKCHRAGGDPPVTPPTDSQPPKA